MRIQSDSQNTFKQRVWRLAVLSIHQRLFYNRSTARSVMPFFDA